MALGKPAAKKAAPAAPAKKVAAAPAKKTFPAKKVGGPAAKKVAGARPGPILFKAPADFKPSFFEIEFETLRDGLVRGGSVTVQRVRGKWDNPDAPRFNLAEYDLATLVGVATRLGAMSFAPNVIRRLPPKTKFGLVVRVAKRAADGSLTSGVKGAKFLTVSEKTGKAKWVWVNAQSADQSLLLHRRMRKMGRYLAGAFVEVQLPPTKKKGRAAAEE